MDISEYVNDAVAAIARIGTEISPNRNALQDWYDKNASRWRDVRKLPDFDVYMSGRKRIPQGEGIRQMALNDAIHKTGTAVWKFEEADEDNQNL